MPSPELRLLLLALGTGRERARAGAAALVAGVDPGRLLELAALHGVSALLQLLLQGVDATPAPLREELLARARGSAARAALLRAQMLAALGLLEARGVEALVLKGPALAARWEGPGLRESSDLDLLVRRADAPRAWEALQAGGWREMFPAGPRAAVLRTEREQPFVDGGPFPLDLHWGLHDPHVWPVDEDALWATAAPFDPALPGVRGLGPVEGFVHLVQHGARHLWERLAWVADLGRVLPPGAPLPPGVTERARRLGATRALELALALRREALGLDPPVPIDPVPERLLAAVRAGWEGRGGPRPLRSLALQLELRTTVRARARLLLGELLIPTAEERALLPLPPALDPLLAPVRLLRLLAKHARRARSSPDSLPVCR